MLNLIELKNLKALYDKNKTRDALRFIRIDHYNGKIRYTMTNGHYCVFVFGKNADKFKTILLDWDNFQHIKASSKVIEYIKDDLYIDGLILRPKFFLVSDSLNKTLKTMDDSYFNKDNAGKVSDIGLNAEYLLKIQKAMDCKGVVVTGDEEQASPLLVKPADYTYNDFNGTNTSHAVLMPLRL